jgi:predicted phosphodiesterase
MGLPVKSIKPVGETVTLAEVEAGGAGWEWWLLLTSDNHHDNEYCDVELEKYHLDLAKERGAGIFNCGDIFCAMQGKGDPRSDRAQLRLKDSRNDYFDALVEEAVEFYSPYADHFLMIATGNHEDSVADRHGTDLTKRLVAGLRQHTATEIQPGGMQGWLHLRFAFQSTHSRSYRFRYTHGYGGGGPVTKDLIQANRQLAIIEGADFLLSGHTHDSWYVPQQREYVDVNGNVREREIGLIKIGGYKNEWKSGKGYAVKKGRPPRPLGGWWVRFYYHNRDIRYQVMRVESL